ncbi:hypothetical protein Ddye_002737 [Dipteronia dyeriana]|uniref:CCHC-type domain-containing protein n=1 Tax=Dipteronia dyeriana TaxID=168575 RepID=A0AAD9XS92_9ROSI|nr:hypothetical protein Ddye_002737 [Dipteronia dyeriana]
MFFRYLALGGINDESLWQVYLNSLPVELQGELQRTLETSGRSLQDITLGEIHMFTLAALDKLGVIQRIFSKMLKEGKKYDIHCKLPDSYHLKCKSTEHCDCRSKIKNHFRRIPMKGNPVSSNKKNMKLKYYRKKARRSWNKSSKCYVCGQQRHYAKQCPNKKAKSAKLIHQLKQIADEVPYDADIESIFSEQEYVDPHTTFVL